MSEHATSSNGPSSSEKDFDSDVGCKSVTGPTVVNVSLGVDVAARLVAGHTNDDDLSTAEFIRLRTKLDWHILPLLFLLYTGQ